MVQEIKDMDFSKAVQESSKPVVIDFWASWCGPCKMLAPVIDEISEELNDKVEFLKLNVDENPVTSNQYRVASIPTVMIFKDGKVVDTLVGFRPKEAIKSVIEKHI
ncbi:thiol-disulfide isomerase [Clostridium carboxidivorans P7]|uniref:Thioredoxin n=1 Tax=Clostridium carboxidivorans P7 TaxID=536227 RepID=C6PZP6_9CLOT|nr:MULTISPECIES: thioredoxin [Clostridium]AKN32923.1 thiol-disulfide isomerase [Clostridium carboxidivorans P7]EET85287.1 thioredoxin [Clostridium carboxidivorans P7]EFG89821.1 thioredoxin [Clostridium carboxidivorans P7]WPC41705.1 thioredoxin [Clostridium sp. JS66]